MRLNRRQVFEWLVRALFVLYFIYLCIAVVGKRPRFDFMVQNAFLAYVPIEFACALQKIRNRWAFWILFTAWLLFYPNAPYVMTDFYHLAKINPYRPEHRGLLRPDMNIWLHFTTVAFGAILCTLAGTWSLRLALNAAARRVKALAAPVAYHGAAFFIMACASFGMYLGRFPRLHSYQVVLEPGTVLAAAISPESGRDCLFFIASATFLQLLVWLLSKPPDTFDP
jgi:uncharacterized membrane protein